MGWRQLTVIFIISFIGTCGIISVDQQCLQTTGEGGKIGLSFDKTEDDTTAFCFFGLEGEFRQ